RSRTMVGPRQVLTTGYNVYYPAYGGWAKSIRVVPGLNGDEKPYGETWGRRFRVTRSWKEDQFNSGDRFGLITLADDLGRKTGWLGMMVDPYQKGRIVNVAGYQERDQNSKQVLFVGEGRGGTEDY